MTGFAKRGLIYASNFSTLRRHYLPCVLSEAVERLSYHYTKLTVNFSLIAKLHMKLCLIKVAKSEACIRSLFCKSGHIFTQYVILFCNKYVLKFLIYLLEFFADDSKFLLYGICSFRDLVL